MRLSSLCVAAFLLLSVATFAQHSSAGGGGGSSSSGSSGGSSGGGSHGSSGGSSSSASSGGGHSSGGSGSSSSAHSSGGGSSSHVSSGHSSGGSSSQGSTGRSSSGHSSIATPAATHPGVNNTRPVSNSQTNHERSVREPSTGARVKTETPAKRSLFGFLRHPFRRPLPNPEPKPVTDLRRPAPCLRAPCTVCPPGQAHAGGCGGVFYIRHQRNYCPSGEIWNGGECLLQTQFLDSCNGFRMAMQRQQQRMQAAESARQSACAAGSSQGCLDSTSAAQSEAGLYRTFQARYQRCMQQSLGTYPFAGFGFGYGHRFGFSGYSSGVLYEPLDLQFDYP
jgi:hypothetical protein